MGKAINGLRVGRVSVHCHGVRFRSVIFASFLVAVLLVQAPSGALETKHTFDGGLTQKQIQFPNGGGNDSSLTITLPRQITVINASLEVEGQISQYGDISRLLEIGSSGQCYAWDGNISGVPPAKTPNECKVIDVTSDNALWADDGKYHTTSGYYQPQSQLFAFCIEDNLLTNFTFYWKGNTMEQNNTNYNMWFETSIYVYNVATSTWDFFVKGGVSYQENELSAKVTANPMNYVNSTGFITGLATTAWHAGTDVAWLMTDYVNLGYTGKERHYPWNVSLDIAANNVTEFLSAGRMNTTASFSGVDFVTAIQEFLDGSTGQNVTIVLAFHADKGGAILVRNLTIDYELLNVAPVLKFVVAVSPINEDTNAAKAVDLRDYFMDDHGVDNLTFAVSYEQNSSLLHAAINADGHSLDLSTVIPDWFGTLSFRVRATDASGLSVESNTFEVEVQSVNDEPVLTEPPALVAKQDVPFNYTFSATDVDLALDANEVLTFSTNASFFNLEPATGRMTLSPRNANAGAHYFQITVTDSAGANDSMLVSLTVENKNDPPVLQKVPNLSVDEDRPFSLMLNASDPDLLLGLDTLSFYSDSTDFPVSILGNLSFTPTNAQVGVHNVSVWVTDLAGLRDTCNFTITVVNVNDRPAIAPIQNMTVIEKTPVSFRVNATDEDVGDFVTFKDDSPLFTINALGWVNFTPAQKDVGVNYVNITAVDLAGANMTVQFVITVVNVNDAPANVTILAPQNGTKYTQGANITFRGAAVDADGDKLTYAWYSNGMPVGAGQNFSTKSLKPGTHRIVLKVTDGTLETSSAAVTITIKAKEKPTTVPGFEAALALGALAACGAILGLRRRP